MRKILTALLAICLITVMSACGEENESTNTVYGGWEIDGITSQQSLPEDIQKVFEKATVSESEYTLEPVAYIGTQVVAGSNHMILCRATTSDEREGTYKVAIIYADLEGNAELTSLCDFSLEDYVEGEGAASREQLSGGWNVPESDITENIPEDVQKAYNKAYILLAIIFILTFITGFLMMFCNESANLMKSFAFMSRYFYSG